MGFVYCPFHKTWEKIVDDPGGVLCEWCCQPRPCPMDHEGGDEDEEKEMTAGRERRGWMGGREVEDVDLGEWVDLT